MARVPAQSFRLPLETVTKINQIAVDNYMDKSAVIRWAIDVLHDQSPRKKLYKKSRNGIDKAIPDAKI